MKNIIILLSILLPLFLISCTHSTSPDGNPEWVKNLIATYEKDSVGNPPQSIWQYEYNGQIVYYVPPQCCDQFSTLYDANGTVICAPDGGFTGHGDGKCSDFFQERKNEKLIWKDPRTG
ncbi:MAG TPA: hypothetical protein VF352_05115 [Anaerolineales bacterium]